MALSAFAPILLSPLTTIFVAMVELSKNTLARPPVVSPIF